MNICIFPGPEASLNKKRYFFGYRRMGNWIIRVLMKSLPGCARECAYGSDWKIGSVSKRSGHKGSGHRVSNIRPRAGNMIY